MYLATPEGGGLEDERMKVVSLGWGLYGHLCKKQRNLKGGCFIFKYSGRLDGGGVELVGGY